MQAPAHTTPLDQGIGADQALGLGPILGPEQQHAPGPIAIEALAIGPIAAAGLVTSQCQVLQPSQVFWDHRIELGLGHDPLFQLDKPGHGSSCAVTGLVPQEDSDQKAQTSRNQPPL
jgi:hypothetical protein